jgi:hypothetical protein
VFARERPVQARPPQALAQRQRPDSGTADGVPIPWRRRARHGRAAGRDGEPRTAALCYFALGPDAEQAARDSLGDYYAFLGEDVEQVIEEPQRMSRP